MAKINKQHKWDTCVHALCPFGRGFGSVLEEREAFSQMMARIEQNEFSDVLVCHIDRIYKLGYDPESFAEYVDKISAKAVIHTIE